MPFSHNTQIGINNFLTHKFTNQLHASKHPVLQSIDDKRIKGELRQQFYLGDQDRAIFAHQKQSFHVVHLIESPLTDKLTLNTQVGILHNHEHKRTGVFGEEIERRALSFEMLAVALADYITWPNNDLDEAIKKGFISPEEVYSVRIENSNYTIGDLGMNYDERVLRLIDDVIEFNTKHQSLEKEGYLKGQSILLSPFFFTALNSIRELFLHRILESPQVDYRAKIVQEAAGKLLQSEAAAIYTNELESPLTYRSACDKIWRMSDYEFVCRVHELGLQVAKSLLELVGNTNPFI